MCGMHPRLLYVGGTTTHQEYVYCSSALCFWSCALGGGSLSKVRVDRIIVSSLLFPVSQNKGGAIYNLGTLNLLGGSLFEGNVAAGSGEGGSGGGIYNGGEGTVS